MPYLVFSEVPRQHGRRTEKSLLLLTVYYLPVPTLEKEKKITAFAKSISYFVFCAAQQSQ
jgi:hypothetical protein